MPAGVAVTATKSPRPSSVAVDIADLEAVRKGMPDAEVVMRVGEAYGIPVPACRVVASVDEALEAVKVIGFPVVLKTADRRVVHKALAGGVSGVVASDGELQTAFSAITGSVSRYLGSPADSVLVQEYVSSSRFEAFVGVKTDAEVGPVISVGFGGALVEVLRIIESDVLPLDGDSVRRLVEGSRLREVFDRLGHEDDGVAESEFVSVIKGVAMLYQEIADDCVELELNPVLVGTREEGVCAVDFRVIRADLL